jgi:Tol biopolymer transport system component
MKQVTWCALLAVVGLGAIAGCIQDAQAQIPRATVRELATIEGMVNGYPVLLPSGRALIYTQLTDGATLNFPRAGDSTFVYDVATNRRTFLGTNMLTGSVSPRGDRLAFDRTAEDGTGDFLWTMPIDPQTGLATGQAQRVSLRSNNGASAKFSPDGEMLAFNAGPRPDGTWDLTIVPATGGLERVVANYAMPGSPAWSADGQSLYVGHNPNNNRQTAIERVPLAGGRRESLVPQALAYPVNRVGLSPDARVAVLQRNPDRFFYRTASGLEGEISVALPPMDWGSGRDMTLNSMRYTTMTHVFNERVRVLDLSTGQARALLPGNVQSSAPAWSPDGRRLAVLTGSASHRDITVVNADGSSARHYPMPLHLDAALGGAWEKPWSPDGRFLAFRATAQTGDQQKVAFGPDDRDQLALLDVASGETRVLATLASAPNESYERFVWRSDGSAIRSIKRADPPSESGRSRYSVIEIPLNGPERLLRDISAEVPNATGPFAFISDRAVIATVTAERGTERFLVPLDGGAVQRLPDPGTEPGLGMGGPLVGGNRLLFGFGSPGSHTTVVRILSTTGDAARTLRLPLDVPNAVVLPDGENVVTIGKRTGDSVWNVFLVPLDGSAMRRGGEIPRGTGGLLAPSPDGTMLAYTSEGILTTKVFEIDFSPALQEILQR